VRVDEEDEKSLIDTLDVDRDGKATLYDLEKLVERILGQTSL